MCYTAPDALLTSIRSTTTTTSPTAMAGRGLKPPWATGPRSTDFARLASVELARITGRIPAFKSAPHLWTYMQGTEFCQLGYAGSPTPKGLLESPVGFDQQCPHLRLEVRTCKIMW
ncbi:hypothetical protein Zmor_004075 [Zophobas morio]|uniref:Uncharacterized protein n=1 Tax=Zophobas morio TaxID=2755281 RepID=A0AA38HL50_9CUCU|nr:hypothetical protein Zmor_004075 [Zophobas morio]